MILFLNHSQERCGVYQMGRRIGHELARAKPNVKYYEGSVDGARKMVALFHPSAIVYNWHPSTLPWTSEIIKENPRTRHVGLIHEISPDQPMSGRGVFHYRMVCEPGFPSNDRNLFSSVRHVPRSEKRLSPSERLTIGSFGFAVGGKLFHHVVKLVSEVFPDALFRLHMPRAFFGDDAGAAASGYAATCRDLAGSVELEISHDFLSEEALLAWLSLNDLNVFFYEQNTGRGVSSVIDYAIGAQQPIAVNSSAMFRHVHARLGYHPVNHLRDLLATGSVVESLYQEWSPERLVQDYDRMFDVLGVQ